MSVKEKEKESAILWWISLAFVFLLQEIWWLLSNVSALTSSLSSFMPREWSTQVWYTVWWVNESEIKKRHVKSSHATQITRHSAHICFKARHDCNHIANLKSPSSSTRPGRMITKITCVYLSILRSILSAVKVKREHGRRMVVVHERLQRQSVWVLMLIREGEHIVKLC